MNHTLENGEQLSALADGQLLADEAQHTLDWLARDPDAQADWNAYHLLGDVMRLGALASPAREAAFMQRLNEALTQEIPPNPKSTAIKIGAGQARIQGSKALNALNNQAANDAVFQWRMAGGFAALVAVVVLAWQGLSAGLAPGPQLTQVIVPERQALAALPLVLAQEAAPVMLRDPQLDAFLAAHKQFGGTSAFQKPSGFLSNAVFEGAPR